MNILCINITKRPFVQYSNYIAMINTDISSPQRALHSNEYIHRYIIAANHAFLWVAALSLAGFFHVSPRFTPHQALLLSTLVAYCAYLCESGLGTWRVAASQSNFFINFKKAAMWRWVWLNAGVNVVLSLLFIWHPSWIWIVAVIFTAGWQKYMDGRIPPRLQDTMIPITNNKFTCSHEY